MSFRVSDAVNPTKVFLTPSSKLESRWDPNYYRGMAEFRRRVKHCVAPIEKLKRSLDLVQYGISELATEDPVGVPMLRMINLQDDSWDLSDLKYIEMPEEQKRPYLLKSGDILFNRTNSKELVGKCVVFNLPDEYVFASYLIRVRLKADTLLPDYVTAYLSSSLGRIQIDAISRQIAGMTNINGEEIRGLLIPVLNENDQKEVVAAWQSAIRRRDETLSKAGNILASIDDLLLHQLGIEEKSERADTLKSRIFLTSFDKMTGHRWDSIYHQDDIFSFIRNAKYSPHSLDGKVSSFITGFAAGKADQVESEDHGVIQLRPTNMSDDRELVFRRNVYISKTEVSRRKADVLKRREVLFNNTNSQDLVGKSVCFDLDGVFFCSNHITRITPKDQELDPKFLTYILNLYQRRKVFFKLCTNWNNQSGVSPEVLKRIPIPLPKISRQAAIVERLEEVRETARTLREQARTELEKAKQEIEGTILGKKLR